MLEAMVTEQDVEPQKASFSRLTDFGDGLRRPAPGGLEAPLSDGAILRVTADLWGPRARPHPRSASSRHRLANVLLHAPSTSSRTARTELRRLADFGIAVGLSQLAAMSHRRYFSFMAPEHLRGKSKDYGPATDLSAVGCLVWYLVYGQVPHQIGSNSMSDLIDKRLYDEPVQLDAGVDPHPIFHPWLLRILSYDPWSRFGHAADARSALLSHTVKRKRSATSPHRKLPTNEAIAADQETAMEIAPLPMTGRIEVEFAATLDMNAMLGRSHKQTETAVPPSAPAASAGTQSTPKDGHTPRRRPPTRSAASPGSAGPYAKRHRAARVSRRHRREPRPHEADPRGRAAKSE